MAAEPVSVLVVDDEPHICDGIEMILCRAGYRVTTALSGEEAIAAAGREPFDLVLLDMMLPGMDGLESCAAIRRLQPKVPVIAISGARTGQRAESLQSLHGVEIFLEKPFGKAELLSAVAQALGSRSLS